MSLTMRTSGNWFQHLALISSVLIATGCSGGDVESTQVDGTSTDPRVEQVIEDPPSTSQASPPTSAPAEVSAKDRFGALAQQIIEYLPASGSGLDLPAPPNGCPMLNSVEKLSWLKDWQDNPDVKLGVKLGTIGLYVEKGALDPDVREVFPESHPFAFIWCESDHSEIWSVTYPTGALQFLPVGQRPPSTEELLANGMQSIDFEDSFGSSLYGYCENGLAATGTDVQSLEYSSQGLIGHCEYLIVNDSLVVRMTTTPYAQPMIDWMQGDWVTSMEEFFTPERLAALATVVAP